MFFITAGTFAGMSLYGYTTKRDLAAMGSFLFMGLIGIVLASLVNIFLASSALQFAISVIGVVVFAGLTAWDTQRIKEMYSAGDDQRDGHQEGHPRRLPALSRLHQPVHHAAAAHGQPPLSSRFIRLAKRPGLAPGRFAFGGAAWRQFAWPGGFPRLGRRANIPPP